jgi:addiction module HigA family antidote
MAILREAVSHMNFDDIAAPGWLDPVTPGEVLREEFMAPLNLSARALAAALGVPANRITGIMNGTRAITADTALLLAKYFQNSPRFWLNLQMSYDLAIAERRTGHAA